jgi:hypothetical protein
MNHAPLAQSFRPTIKTRCGQIPLDRPLQRCISLHTRVPSTQGYWTSIDAGSPSCKKKWSVMTHSRGHSSLRAHSSAIYPDSIQCPSITDTCSSEHWQVNSWKNNSREFRFAMVQQLPVHEFSGRRICQDETDANRL